MKLTTFARRVLPFSIFMLVACSDPVGTPPNPDGEGKNPPEDETKAVSVVTDSTAID